MNWRNYLFLIFLSLAIFSAHAQKRKKNKKMSATVVVTDSLNTTSAKDHIDSIARTLYINDIEVKPDTYFFLFADRHISIHSSPSLALQESGMPWFIDLKDELEENASDSSFNIKTFIENKTKEAASKGATALFIYNTSSVEDGFSDKGKYEPFSIPVMYINHQYAKDHFNDLTAVLDVKLNIE